MELHALFSFLIASILLSIMPGPDNIYVLTESIVKGKKNGISISAGLASGIIIHTLVIATGLALFIQQSPWVFTGIKFLGAIYLFYLAFLCYQETDNSKKISIQEEFTPTPSEKNFIALYKKGLLMNVLNPKVTLFFIAFLPQFVHKGGYSFKIQIFILGFIFMIQAFLIFSLIAILAAQLRPLLQSSQFWNKIRWAQIIVLSLLGIFLLIGN